MTNALDEGLELDICDSGYEDEVPEVTGSEAAYLQFRDEARAIPDGEVVVCRANVSVAYHNVKRGVDAVSHHRDVIARLPGIDAKRILELSELSLAVVYAAAIAARVGEVSTNDYRNYLSRVNAARRGLLHSLEACSAFGLVPKEEIAPIRKGTGPLDAAGDVVALVALFRKYEDVLANKTPVTPAFLQEASEVSTTLLRSLKPRGTPVGKTPRSPEQMADDRDRLWTLLVRGHRDLRRVAAFLFGDDAEEKVPLLQSRLRSAPKKHDVA